MKKIHAKQTKQTKQTNKQTKDGGQLSANMELAQGAEQGRKWNKRHAKPTNKQTNDGGKLSANMELAQGAEQGTGHDLCKYNTRNKEEGKFSKGS